MVLMWQQLQDFVWADGKASAGHSVKVVALLALVWASLELAAYVLIRPFFVRLVAGNAKIDAKGRAKAVTQMLPRAVCFVHNCMQVPLGVMVLADVAFNADWRGRLLHATPFSTTVMAVSAGYFAYDTLECVLRFENEGPDFLFHGVFCLAVFASITHIRAVHWFGAGFLMWEMSTPFVHFRWFLFKIAKGEGTAANVNAALGMLVFFAARICWGPFISILYWKDSIAAFADAEIYDALPHKCMWFFRLCTFTMNGLNYWWFYRMLQLAFGRGGRGKAGKGKAAAVKAA